MIAGWDCWHCEDWLSEWPLCFGTKHWPDWSCSRSEAFAAAIIQTSLGWGVVYLIVMYMAYNNWPIPIRVPILAVTWSLREVSKCIIVTSGMRTYAQQFLWHWLFPFVTFTAANKMLGGQALSTCMSASHWVVWTSMYTLQTQHDVSASPLWEQSF
jgi:hypothetical protein